MKRAIVLAFGIIATVASPLALKASADPATASEQQIAGDRYQVRVQGGADVTAEQLRERAMLRAQLTTEKGGDWFEIVPRSTSPRAISAASNADFGLNYSIEKSCTAAGCLTKATPVTTDAGETPILQQSIEIMIGSGETLEGGKKIYNARDMIAKLSAKLS